MISWMPPVAEAEELALIRLTGVALPSARVVCGLVAVLFVRPSPR